MVFAIARLAIAVLVCGVMGQVTKIGDTTKNWPMTPQLSAALGRRTRISTGITTDHEEEKNCMLQLGDTTKHQVTKIEVNAGALLDNEQPAPWDPAELQSCATTNDATDGFWEGERWLPWNCKLSDAGDAELQARFAGKKLLLYGDSQGTHLAERLAGILSCHQTKLAPFPQCPQTNPGSLMSFFNSNDPGVSYGCVECNGCVNTMYTCAHGTELWSVVAEFMDQTSITSAQNPTLVQWLFKSFVPQYNFDYVLGNIGLHEITKIEAESSEAPFEERTAAMTALLSELVAQGRKVLFILTGDVRRDKDMAWVNITSSYHVHIMNNVMRTALTDAGIPIADPFRLSRFEGDNHALHTDRVHMLGKDGLYYKTLARIILSTL